MTSTDHAPAALPDAQAYDIIDRYLVYATNLLPGEPPRLTLECPPGCCPDADHERCSISKGCLHNLVGADSRRGPVELGDLVQLAVDHANARDGYTPPTCSTIDVPGVGPTRVQADGDMPDELKTALGDVIRAAQRKAAEDLKAQGRAQLVGRLVALRQTWKGRQNEAIYTRETADGPTAGIAGARADLLGQLLAELDRVVSGG